MILTHSDGIEHLMTCPIIPFELTQSKYPSQLRLAPRLIVGTENVTGLKGENYHEREVHVVFAQLQVLMIVHLMFFHKYICTDSKYI